MSDGACSEGRQILCQNVKQNFEGTSLEEETQSKEDEDNDHDDDVL